MDAGRGGGGAVPTLATARLRLRPLRRSDLDALAGVLGDPVGMSFYPHPFSREESLDWIEREEAHLRVK